MPTEHGEKVVVGPKGEIVSLVGVHSTRSTWLHRRHRPSHAVHIQDGVTPKPGNSAEYISRYLAIVVLLSVFAKR